MTGLHLSGHLTVEKKPDPVDAVTAFQNSKNLHPNSINKFIHVSSPFIPRTNPPTFPPTTKPTLPPVPVITYTHPPVLVTVPPTYPPHVVTNPTAPVPPKMKTVPPMALPMNPMPNILATAILASSEPVQEAMSSLGDALPGDAPGILDMEAEIPSIGDIEIPSIGDMEIPSIGDMEIPSIGEVVAEQAEVMSEVGEAADE